jgi:cell division protein FtsW (lipid II flippase)
MARCRHKSQKKHSSVPRRLWVLILNVCITCFGTNSRGIRRWVGLGVIADNLINIGHALAPSAER